ncbi:hypothetical protein CRENBAI_026249 [Crenichthys baileyi]|uniref:Ubiquitin-like domain-containing protein n=1 Tax=Crenichthys baileyi TaxID=28760 RepID=A0AAV9RL50_9TELE
MLKPGETGEDIERQGEAEHAEESPQSLRSAARRPPGGGRDSGRFGEEDCPDRSSPDVQQNVKDTGTQAKVALETVEEAQYDFPTDAEEHDEKTNVKNLTATVKVLLVPGGHVMTMAFAIGLSIEEIKHHLASELKVPLEVLQLSLDGRVVEEHQSLMKLGIRPHSSTQMEMSSSDPSSYPLRLLRPPEHDSMPDVITVQVPKEEGVFKEVVVEIKRSCHQKPFLGGYRHRLTGVEYHHASVQTLLKKKPDRAAVLPLTMRRWTVDRQVSNGLVFPRGDLRAAELEVGKKERLMVGAAGDFSRTHLSMDTEKQELGIQDTVTE